jgi:TRAP-type mannitol/chloroaromatic compound transport system permease large subunit
LIESSAIGAVGAVVAAAINRKLSWEVIKTGLEQTLSVTSMMMWIFVAAILFSSVFDGLGAVRAIEPLLTSVGGGRWGTLIVMQLSFILMGMVLDDTAMLLIVAPLYVPIVQELGFSMVWFGVLYVITCQIAYMTPPFGYNLFIMKAIAPKEITMVDIYRSAIPFIGIMVACMAIIMVFPQIALWLPNSVFGQ